MVKTRQELNGKTDNISVLHEQPRKSFQEKLGYAVEDLSAPSPIEMVGEEDGKKDYNAVAEKTPKVHTLEIRSADENISEDFPINSFRTRQLSDNHIELYSPAYSCTIKIEGQNLFHVKEMIRKNKTEFVQEWCEKRFKPPKDNEPIITSIDFLEYTGRS